jgi:hypothetical protein
MLFVSKDKIEQITQEVVDRFLVPKFKELGLNASGDWLASVEVRVNGTTGEIWALDYTRYLVNGRAAGTPPPVEPLIRWVGFKLGKSGDEARGIAYAIRNKIAREGTEIKKQGGTDLLEILSSREVLDYVNERIGEAIVETARLQIIRNAKKILS